MTFSCRIEPRFCETDALGHINNTALPAWFEFARGPVFEMFNPSLDLDKWNVILRRIDVDFLRQLHMTGSVEVRTTIEKIGNSSLTLRHEAWQGGELAATGEAVLIHFDYRSQQKADIPAEIRERLEAARIKGRTSVV